MIRTWCFHCQGQGSILGRGTKIPHGAARKKKKFKFEISAVDNNMPLKALSREHVPSNSPVCECI